MPASTRNAAVRDASGHFGGTEKTWPVRLRAPAHSLLQLRQTKGASMSNRISKYYGRLSDVQRRENSRVCAAVLRTLDGNPRLEPWEIEALSNLHGGAVYVFRSFGIPLPWERSGVN